MDPELFDIIDYPGGDLFNSNDTSDRVKKTQSFKSNLASPKMLLPSLSTSNKEDNQQTIQTVSSNMNLQIETKPEKINYNDYGADDYAEKKDILSDQNQNPNSIKAAHSNKNSEKKLRNEKKLSFIKNQSPEEEQKEQTIKFDSKAISVVDDININKEISKSLEKKYLVFRPYIDPLTVKPYVPPDRGYYFKILNCDIKIVRYTLEDNGFKEVKDNNIDWTVMWYCGSIKTQIYQALTKFQKVNHFPKSSELTRKDRICENMNRMNELYGDEHYDFVPKTFNLPREFDVLNDEMEKNPSQWWIVKPAASSQGKGIYFTNKIDDVSDKQNIVVSHYVNNPMLINGYKYDLRIYIAVMSINPLRLYNCYKNKYGNIKLFCYNTNSFQ